MLPGCFILINVIITEEISVQKSTKLQLTHGSIHHSLIINLPRQLTAVICVPLIHL